MSVGFWTQIGYHTQGQNGAGLGYFNEYPNKIQLQQQWAYIEKAVDNGGCGFDWGFRMDYVYGTDGPNTQAFGSVPGHWDTSWDHGVGDTGYGHAIPQLYAEVAYNDLKVKMGHFFTIVGYEVVPATGNFFYSHAYTMNYGEPFTHTGFLGEYSASDDVTLYAGYTFGWDTGFEDFLDAHTFLGGVSMQLSDSSSLAYMVNTGEFGDGTGKAGFAGNAGNIFMQSVVYTRNLSDDLEYVFQTDYGTNTGKNGTGNEWYGVNQYLFYTLNDCWKAGARYEIFRDQAGAGQTGRVGNGVEVYNAATLGLNYTPTANLTIRPETRWDWVNRGSGAYSGNNSLFTFGIDAILTF
ncbi:MAG: porin [Planctomycetales bacterium]|nr:porin [Planctomycetales bacterium]